MGSIAATAALNQKEQFHSPTLPILGYSPTIKWHYVIALFVCIGVVHVMLVGLLCWVARPVVVCDDSDLCTARLLHGLADRIPDGRGALLGGKMLTKAIDGATMDNNVATGGEVSGTSLQESTRVIYGIVDMNDKVGTKGRHLGISESIQSLRP